MDEIASPTHLGTHLDAPCHFAKGHACVGDIPAERLFSRPGYIIDITSKCAQDRDYALNAEDFASWIKQVGSVEDGAVILVRTGWSRYWPNRKDYFGLDASNDSRHFPGVAPSAAKLMVSTQGLKIYGLGIEGPSVDYGQSKDFQTHRILAKEDIFALENVGPSIAKLPSKDFLVTALPIRIDGASGSPVRIVIHSKSNSCDQLYLTYTLPLLIIALIPLVHYVMSP